MNPSMTLRWLRPVLACAALTSVNAVEPPADLRELLREALYKEEVNRDPDAAAKAYQELLAKNEEQRAFAATAQFRLAEVRRKQGRNAEAIAAYQQLLVLFPEATAEIKLAKENLKALGVEEEGKASPEPAPVSRSKDEQDENFLRELQEIVRTRPDALAGMYQRVLGDEFPKSLEYYLDHANPPSTNAVGGDSLIGLAADRGSLADVQIILKHQRDPATAANRDVMVEAARSNQIHIMKALLAAGLDANSVKPNYLVQPSLWIDAATTPLSAAAQAGNTEIVELLLKHGANVNQTLGPNGQTALHMAVQARNASGVKRLLEAGADANALVNISQTPSTVLYTGRSIQAEFNVSPLDIAVFAGDSEISALLEKSGAKMHESNLLLLAEDDVIERLLAHGLKADGLRGKFREITGYQRSSEAPKRWELLKKLFSHGLTADRSDFLYVCGWGSLPVIEAMVTQSALPEGILTDTEVVELASKNPALLKLLLEKGMPVSDAMMEDAVRNKRTDVLQLLLEHGGNANALTKDPLHPQKPVSLLFEGSTETSALLLEKGANPNVVIPGDESVGTPLLLAISNRQQALAKTLLEHGADPNLPTMGRALVAAVASGQFPSLFQMLVEKGARPDEDWLAAGFLSSDDANSKSTSQARSLLFRTFTLPRMQDSRDVTWVGQAGEKLVSQVLEPRSPWDHPRPLAEQLYSQMTLPNAKLPTPGRHLVIWRKVDGDGPRQKLEVDLMSDEPYPALEWGDIVDATELPESDSETTPDAGGNLLHRIREHIRIEVTLEMDGTAYPVTLNGAVESFDLSGNEFRYFDAEALVRFFSMKRAVYQWDGNLTVLRKDWPVLELKRNPPTGARTIYLTNGDRVVWKTGDKDGYDRRFGIAVTSPGNPFWMRVASHPGAASNLPESFEVNDLPAIAKPTLMQAIAEVYRYRDGDVLAYPDFSKIRIRHFNPGKEEFILEVNLKARMEALPAEFTAKQARSVDEDLQLGDIVEIPVEPGPHPGDSWKGLSPLMTAVMGKALSFDLQVIDSQKRATVKSMAYQPLTFRPGAKGGLEVIHKQGRSEDPTLGSAGLNGILAIRDANGKPVSSYFSGQIYPKEGYQYEEDIPLKRPAAQQEAQPPPRRGPDLSALKPPALKPATP